MEKILQMAYSILPTGEATNLRVVEFDYEQQPDEIMLEFYSSGDAVIIPCLSDLHIEPYKSQKIATDYNNQICEELKNIDLKSIRSLREYIASLPDAPTYIKDYENQAVAEREKIR